LTLPPLVMRPRLVEKIWGGQRLKPLAPDDVADGARIGEAWCVSDLPEGASTVDGGAHDGRTLTELCEAEGAALVGSEAKDGRFPLLIKLLDTEDDLSVQVHPGPKTASLVEGARSKEEAWLILRADEGARLLFGFEDGVDEPGFRDAIAAGRAHELLRAVRATAGDVVHVSPGTFHAVGAGFTLLEVQEPSDTTFRVWDFGRLGLDGEPRALHIEPALKVARFGEQPAPLVAGASLDAPAGVRATALVDAGPFRMQRLSLSAGAGVDLSLGGGSPVVVFTEEGRCGIETPAGRVEAAALRCTVVPADSERLRIVSDDDCTVVLAALGSEPLLGGSAAS
jgi:mannose-6-phosphate isomerase